ncbi:ABC transporter ATP-binding protein [Dyella nitratireducens]
MIHMEAITRRYEVGEQPVAALDKISITVPRGQFVAIVGPSGSGKSTLLNMLGCLDRPDSGSYLLDGVDVSNFDDERASDFRNRRIGFVFQSFHLLPRLSVLENTLLPRRFLRGSDEGLEQRAHELLERMGLQRHLAHRPSQLSGGQMQRVAIARALLMKPALLLADEPTGNLDSRSAAEVMALITEVHAEGQTVLLVTHDADVAARAQRQISLCDGRIERDSAA